ncbi:MAG: glucosamine-6-phosphate deaminase [Planctomycetia bacterium]|nr:glucosamine-6-phosphate deaminase [Planctomycetia bacterium]
MASLRSAVQSKVSPRKPIYRNPQSHVASSPGGMAERLPVTVYGEPGDASRSVACDIAELIRERALVGKKTVLGLATGSTPVGVYDELIRLHREEGLSLKTVVTFNLDEYWPIEPDALQSYHRFMREHLFDHVDIPADAIHIPDGRLPREQVAAACVRYEESIRAAGGIDVQLLGIGRTGHIGFNEPGSAVESRTRLITLDGVTRADAASDFFGEWNVPRQAITMGVGSILDARRIVLVAFGEHKSSIVRKAVEEPFSSHVSASALQQHPDARFVLDRAAASRLARFESPWVVGTLESMDLEWSDSLTRKAVIWLALKMQKPILKLTDEDYNEHGLQELLSKRGRAYDLNIEVFRVMQNTITGWPGGKPGKPSRVREGVVVEPTAAIAGHKRAAGADIFPKRVVIFSPHPDDDVISMGGTFIRLCEQGHEVHVAYQTSGNIAVWDESADRHVDFVGEFCRAFGVGNEPAAIADRVRLFLRTKGSGAVDLPELQIVKGLIRRTEARAAARYSGIKPERIHFLDLPFYETGRVRKKPIGPDDIAITVKLLDDVKPHQIYAAGDLSDPHGTHRVCLVAVMDALRALAARDWVKECELWLYRGAWQEWEPHEIEMAVPLSPDEVDRKRMAIFKHESQKDRALFPGPTDSREFWQRAEDRNRETARLYDKLGLPEYEAIEGFVLHRMTDLYGGEK